MSESMNSKIIKARTGVVKVIKKIKEQNQKSEKALDKEREFLGLKNAI